jgi:NADPH:quinone reductase-like Zn-dependent oxidoreductase
MSKALRIIKGESVLVGGSGGVTGGLLVQLAALMGARVIATAGPSSASRVRAPGAGEVVDYTISAGRNRSAAWASPRQSMPPAGAAATIRAVGEGGQTRDNNERSSSRRTRDRAHGRHRASGCVPAFEAGGTTGLDVLVLNVAKVCTLDQAGAAVTEVVAGKIRGAVVVKSQVRLSADR